MKIKPNDDFTSLGLGYNSPKLDKSKVYDAVPATNQPDWEEKGKVFVSFNNDGQEPSMLLDKFDYQVIEL
jgi:hypothetical protein